MRMPATGAPPAAPPSPSGTSVAARRGLIRWAAPLLVSGAILAYLFTTQGVDPRALVPLVRAISLPGLAAYVAVSAAGLVLRALRYRLLLGRPVALWPLVLVTAVRNMAVDLIPARAGAAASYLYLVTARLGLPLEAAVASFALSFILDTLAVAPLLVVALLVVGNAPMSSTLLVVGSLAILVGSVAALWVLAPLLRLGAAVVERLPAPVRRLAPLLGAAAAEVETRERTRVLLPALGLSLLLRLTKYGAYYCLLQALLVSQGAAWGSLSFLRVFLVGGGGGGRRVAAAPDPHEPRPLRGRRRRGAGVLARSARELATLAATAFHGLSQVHDYALGLFAWMWIMTMHPPRPAEAVPDGRRRGPARRM